MCGSNGIHCCPVPPLQGYPGENAWISGGVELNAKWTKSTKPGLWVADLSAHNLDDVTGLRVNDVRATRARYPNVKSIETNLFPDGWIASGAKWGPNLYPPKPEVNIEVASPNRSFMMNEFQSFELGVRVRGSVTAARAARRFDACWPHCRVAVCRPCPASCGVLCVAGQERVVADHAPDCFTWPGLLQQL